MLLDAFIIDDDPVHHKITEYYLKKNDKVRIYRCYTSSVKALSDLMTAFYSSDYLPEIVLLDLRMPEIDGWNFLDVVNSIIAEKGSNTSIYIITSSIDPRDKERVKLYSCVKGFYSKPFTDKMLDEIISLFMDDLSFDDEDY